MHRIRPRLARRLPAALILPLFAMSSCEAPRPPEVPPARGGCLQGSYFRGQLFGALAGDVAWTSESMQCEGMRRPKDAGARLRFSGVIDGNTVGGPEKNIAIIVALPSLLEAGAGKEQPARVTIIEEDEGRFFSTRETDVCWADIHEQTRLGTAGTSRRYRLRGLLYCLAPVAELNGAGSVTLGDVEFSGELNWSGERK